VQRRMSTAIAAIGLGLALSVAIAPQSLASQGTDGTTTGEDAREQVPDAVDPGPCQFVDFERAQVTPIASTDPVRPIARYRLTVSGKKPASNVWVRLVPVKHIDQPLFWGIMVEGCSSGAGLPVLTPYTATYEFDWTMGSCGIEVIGAARTQRFDLVGCSPIPLAGTKWVLAPTSLDVPVPAGATITANFSDTTMSGFTSCNSYRATYTIDANGAFGLGPIAMTARVCDPDLGTAESSFLRRLAAVRRVQATATRMRLRNDESILLRFLPATTAS